MVSNYALAYILHLNIKITTTWVLKVDEGLIAFIYHAQECFSNFQEGLGQQINNFLDESVQEKFKDTQKLKHTI